MSMEKGICASKKWIGSLLGRNVQGVRIAGNLLTRNEKVVSVSRKGQKSLY